MKKTIHDIIYLITNSAPPQTFGTPLNIVFPKHFATNSEEENYATAVICLLYISYRKGGFPSDKLRSCICNIDENISKIYFNCNHYDKIIESIPKEMLQDVPIYNSECNIEYATLAEKDILEAFDFYTNR